MTDPFDQAQNEFTTPDDLGEGRLVLAYAKSLGTAPGNNGPYDYVIADIIPLDGNVVPGKIDQVGPKAPAIEMRLSGTMMVNALKVQLKNRPDGQPSRPVLARMNGRPSSQNKRITVWAFGPFREEDRPIAAAAHNDYIASADPFA